MIFATGRPILGAIRKAANAPLVYAVRGQLGRFNSWFVRLADAVIFWGGCERDNPSSVSAGRPVLTIDPCVDEANFFPGRVDREVRSELNGDDPSALVVVSVGRLEPVKQFEHLIHAVARAVAVRSNYRLAVIGDGSARHDYERLAREVLPGRARFFGSVAPERIGELLRASDVFVLTSRMENHPIAIKEALASGLYVIAYDVGRVADLLDDGHNGHLVEPGDIEGVAQALVGFSQNALSSGVRGCRAAPEVETWRDAAVRITEWLTTEFPAVAARKGPG